MLAVGVFACPIASGETKEANHSQKLEELLKERRDTLQQLVDVVTAEYRNGTTGFESVARAQINCSTPTLSWQRTPKLESPSFKDGLN